MSLNSNSTSTDIASAGRARAREFTTSRGDSVPVAVDKFSARAQAEAGITHAVSGSPPGPRSNVVAMQAIDEDSDVDGPTTVRLRAPRAFPPASGVSNPLDAQMQGLLTVKKSVGSFLSLRDINNVVAWFEMRGYLYGRLKEKVSIVEIWIIIIVNCHRRACFWSIYCGFPEDFWNSKGCGFSRK